MSDSLVASRPALRVLVIGEEAVGGLTGSLAAAFADIGWDVNVLKWGPWQPAHIASVALRVPVAAAPFRVGLRLQVDRATSEEFDLVLVVKGALLNRRVVDHMRRRAGAPVVCWNPDDPFDAATSNSGGGIRQAVSAYDAYVTWADDVAEKLSGHNGHVVVVPFGWDPHVHHREPACDEFAGRLVFIGTWTPDRQDWVQNIAPWDPLVFGNQWPAIPGVEIRPAVYGREFRRIVGSAAWNLNFLRNQNRLSHNMRTFEIPACGGRELAEDSPDHRRLLKGEGFRLIGSLANLRDVLDDAPPSARPSEEWLSTHTYSRRVGDLLGAIKLPIVAAP